MVLGSSRRCIALGPRIVGTVARQCCAGRSISTATRNAGTTADGLLNFLGGFRSSVSATLLRPASRNFSCCAKVDLPPPREIIVEYEEASENTDHFIQLADGLENANPELMVLGNPDDMQAREGSFEVTAGQQVLFSKLQEKRLPRVEEILLALEQLPTEGLSCELETNDKVATA